MSDNDKSVTIYDIANKAGVSIATVSRVFNDSSIVSEKTRKKVMEVASALGYHPQAFAQGLASKKKNMIMAVVPIISNYFFMEVLAGIQDVISDYKYDLYIFNVTANTDLYEQVETVLKRRWAEGYLFISVHLPDNKWRSLKKYRSSMVIVDDYFTDFDSVSVDSIEGAYSATQYFIERGSKRIALITGKETSKPVKDRITGYRRAIEDAGMEVDPELIVHGDTDYRDGFTERAGFEAMQKLLKMEPLPDACFCASDIQALGALKALKDADVTIPVIGYDDIEISEYVGLSTVRQPMYDMGAIATKKLMERLNDSNQQISHTIFSPEIKIRASSEIEQMTKSTQK